MAAQLAHELTQPLGAIANYAAGSRRRLLAQPTAVNEVVEVIDRIAAEALRAGEIIRRVRGFVRKAELNRAPTDINALVREVAALVDGEARAAGIAVGLVLAPRLPRIAVDAVQIEQVLVNLARNGLDALRESPVDGGTLTISTRESDRGVEVGVCDSGVGFGDGDPTRVFEPFYTTKKDGLGMGLAISRAIVEAHGGRLWVVPNSTRGVTFHLALPREA